LIARLMTAQRILALEHGLRTSLEERTQWALTDSLTGVRNRRSCDEALARMGRRAGDGRRPLSLLMIDTDHFKAFNDCYGHPEGDACLRDVAAALQSALSRPDDVLARYGGEEFVVLLQGVEAPGALVMAERLHAAVEALAVRHAGSPFGQVTLSVGAASSAAPHHAAHAQELLATADAALYEAKRAGRNRVVVKAMAPASA
jgi:diguanylate cyclase (GGDEF)-like protein